MHSAAISLQEEYKEKQYFKFLCFGLELQQLDVGTLVALRWKEAWL